MNKRSSEEGADNIFRAQLYALRQSISILSHHLISTFFLLIFASLLLSLPLTLFSLLHSVHDLAGHLNKNATINVYLDTKTSTAKRTTLINQLKSRSDLRYENYISPKQGLTEFEAQSGLTNIAKNLDDNPIPGVIVLTPTSKEHTLSAIDNIVTGLEKLPHVDNVVVNTKWLTHAYALLHSLTDTLIVFSIIVFFLVLTITTTLFHMLLPRFPIKRPLLTIAYLGVLLGIVGGTISDYVVSYSLLSLKTLLAQLTFINVPLAQVQLSLTNLSLNLLSAIVMMAISGFVVHLYRARN